MSAGIVGYLWLWTIINHSEASDHSRCSYGMCEHRGCGGRWNGENQPRNANAVESALFVVEGRVVKTARQRPSIKTYGA